MGAFIFVLHKLHRYAIDARRRDRTLRYLAWSAISGVARGLWLGIVLSISWVAWDVGLWWIAIPLVVALGAPMLEAVVVRHICVPLGWVRASFYVARTHLEHDAEAYALCIAAWAHAFRPGPAGEAWVIARRDKRTPLGDGEVAVTALLAAGRGDTATTRGLLRSLLEIVEVHANVRELAGEWLACDAAERGAWAELHADATAARWPATPLTYLLEGIAARRIGARGAPSKRELYARWLLAPRRRATRSLLGDVELTRATVSAGDAAETRDIAAHAAQSPMPRAIATHLALMSPPGPATASFGDAVQAWDAALRDPVLTAWIGRRAFELDAPLGAVDRVVGEVARVATDELARVAEAAQLAAPAAIGPVGGPLGRRLRHGRLDALESAFQRWEDRRRNGEVRSSIDEWREFIALRASYEAVATAGGMDLRRLAFPHAYSRGTSMSVWLWNTRKEYALSHAISMWLLAEALAVGDAQAIDTCTQNTRLAVPTRLGKFLPKPS